MRAEDAARYIGISEDSLIRHAKSGSFKWHTANGAMAFFRSELDEHLKQRDAAEQGLTACTFCGSFARIYGPKYRSARKGTLQRSGNVCQLCGLHPATETHHWADPQKYPCDDCITSNDLTALCKVCHDIATELRSLHYYTSAELILGTSEQWAGHDDTLPMVFHYGSQASTRRGNLSISQWIDHNWKRAMSHGEVKPPRPKLEIEPSNDQSGSTTVEMDLSFVIRLEGNLAERARYHALLEGLDFEEWIQDIVSKGLGNGKGVGPWLEALIEDAVNEVRWWDPRGVDEESIRRSPQTSSLSPTTRAEQSDEAVGGGAPAIDTPDPGVAEDHRDITPTPLPRHHWLPRWASVCRRWVAGVFLRDIP